MKWLEKLDAWLIANPYQGLVDLSGKSRAWWVEQCAMAVLVGGLGYVAIRMLDHKVPGWVLILQGLCVVGLTLLLFSDAKVPALMEQTRQRPEIRRSALLVYGLTSIVEVFTPSSGTGPWLLFSLATVSGLYFGACEPPRPRQPRRKLATASSGA